MSADNFSVTTRINGADMEFMDRATGKIVFALRTGQVVDFSGGAGSFLMPSTALAGGGPFQCAYARYDFAVDGGAIGLITPATNTTIPANAIVMGGIINSPTAVTSAGSATVAAGTAAGSSATSMLTATGKASFSTDALIATVPVFTAATSFKMSAAGKLTITVATAALTAGVVEIYAFYVVSAKA